MLYIIGTLRHRVPIASENALQCPHRLKHQKGRKRAEIARKCSALPCNVSCAVAQCRRAYSCKKIGRDLTARFLRFTNFHRCFLSLQISPNSVRLGWFGCLLGFALQVATRGEFGGLRRSFARLLHGGYHLAVELFKAALGIG